MWFHLVGSLTHQVGKNSEDRGELGTAFRNKMEALGNYDEWKGEREREEIVYNEGLQCMERASVSLITGE